MIKRNLFTTLLVLTMAMSIVGCGSNTAKHTEKEDVKESTTSYVNEESRTDTESTTATENTTEATVADATEANTEEAVNDNSDTSEDVLVSQNTSDNENTSDNSASNYVPDTPANNEPEYSYEQTPDTNSSDTSSDTSSSGSGDTGSSNTENKFYNDYMNGTHVVGSEDLIDKDSDPSKPCPYEFYTPYEGVYSGADGMGGYYNDEPVYIVYSLCSEDSTGGIAAKKCGFKGSSCLISLPIGEYDCGLVRASYFLKG